MKNIITILLIIFLSEFSFRKKDIFFLDNKSIVIWLPGQSGSTLSHSWWCCSASPAGTQWEIFSLLHFPFAAKFYFNAKCQYFCENGSMNGICYHLARGMMMERQMKIDVPHVINSHPTVTAFLSLKKHKYLNKIFPIRFG